MGAWRAWAGLVAASPDHRISSDRCGEVRWGVHGFRLLARLEFGLLLFRCGHVGVHGEQAPSQCLGPLGQFAWVRWPTGLFLLGARPGPGRWRSLLGEVLLGLFVVAGWRVRVRRVDEMEHTGCERLRGE